MDYSYSMWNLIKFFEHRLVYAPKIKFHS